MQTAKKNQDFPNETLRELAVLRDEARVRLHLFSMDARQRWQELERSLTDLEQDLRRRGEGASEALVTAAHKLLGKARDFLNSQSNSILF
jgi:hypothetical protein